MNTWKKWKTNLPQKRKTGFTRAGDVAQQLFPKAGGETKKDGDAIAAFTYGNVWARIWRNARRDGTHYYRISLNRIDSRNGETSVRNNFTPSDLQDMQRAVRRCEIWLTKSQT